jgi:hypothetical protein
MSTAQTNAASKSTKTKQQKTATPKKSALKATFMGVHGVSPELVNLFDYMVDQNSTGSKGVTLGHVAGCADNIIGGLEQLLDKYGPETALAEIEDIDEFEDLCC